MVSIGMRLQSTICSRLKVNIQGPRLRLQTRYFELLCTIMLIVNYSDLF